MRVQTVLAMAVALGVCGPLLSGAEGARRYRRQEPEPMLRDERLPPPVDARPTPDLTLDIDDVESPFFAELQLGQETFARYMDRHWLRDGNRAAFNSGPLGHVELMPQLSIGDVFEYTDATVANVQTGLLRVLVPDKHMQPYLVMARQYDDWDSTMRVGFGAGTRWRITPEISFSTEVITFGSESRTWTAPTRPGETMMLGRFEWAF